MASKSNFEWRRVDQKLLQYTSINRMVSICDVQMFQRFEVSSKNPISNIIKFVSRAPQIDPDDHICLIFITEMPGDPKPSLTNTVEFAATKCLSEFNFGDLSPVFIQFDPVDDMAPFTLVKMYKSQGRYSSPSWEHLTLEKLESDVNFDPHQFGLVPGQEVSVKDLHGENGVETLSQVLRQNSILGSGHHDMVTEQ